MFNLAERWLGMDFSQLLAPIKHLQASACPTEIPSVGEADELSRAGLIDGETWSALVTANGTFDTWQALLKQLGRPRAGIQELLTLLLRYPNESGVWLDALREWGLPIGQDLQHYQQLQNYYPDAGVALENSIRGAYDDATALQDGLDDDPSGTLSPELLEYLRGNGLQPSDIKAQWRAHWRLPPWQSVLQMYWRFTAGLLPAGLTVSLDDVKRCMTREGIATEWQDYAIAQASPILRVAAA